MRFVNHAHVYIRPALIGCLVASVIPAVIAQAADLYVDASAKATSGDGKVTSPFNSVTAALAAAQDGDTICVAAGTYPEKVVLLTNGVKLQGGYDATFSGPDPGKHETILDGQGKFRPLQIGDASTPAKRFSIAGFTVRNGIADGVEGTDGKGGGILITNNSSGEIVNCRIADNEATDDGGGIESNSSGAILIDRCLFVNNSAGDDGGAIRLQNTRTKATISNCVFVNNSGLDKYVVQAKGDVKIQNCTFYSNLADDRGIIASRAKAETTDAVVTITNCIFAANTVNGRRPLLFFDDDRSPIVCTNCLFFQNKARGGLGTDLGSDGNVESDPKFVDASGGNLQLQGDSPAIDRGVPIEKARLDSAGNPRVQGTKIDIGAFEFTVGETSAAASR